jgi:hypothetical protein
VISQISNSSQANTTHTDTRTQPRADDYRSRISSPPVPEAYFSNTGISQEEYQTPWCTQTENHRGTDMSGIPGPDFGEFVELKEAVLQGSS